MIKSITVSLFLILGLFLGAAWADQETLFEHQYVRTTGKPNVYDDDFSIRGATSNAVLVIKNGTANGENRVASAVILFNGEQIIGPEEFNQQVYELETPLNLVETNIIWLELAGAPLGYLTVAVINTLPIADPQSITTAEDSAAAITVTGSDLESNVLFFEIENGPDRGALSGTPPHITYTPELNYNGTDSFTFTVDDGASLSIPAAVTITVTPVNDAPVAVDDARTTDEDTALTVAILANDSDVDGDQLVITNTSQGANGPVSVNPDGTITYTPNTDFNGPDSFTYTVDDENGGTDTATVSITVNPVNDAPAADAGADQDVRVFDTVTLNGSGSTDVDGDVLNYQWTIVSGPPESAAALSDPASGIATFIADRSGSYEVQLIVNDGSLDSAPATVMVAADFGPFSATETRLTAGDAEAGDGLGTAVAISGDHAIAGTGSAYVYTREGSGWTEQAKLTAADEEPADHFGAAVAISEDFALVGAYGDDADDGSGKQDTGSAYVFQLIDSTWTEQAKLTDSGAEAGDHFGAAVAMTAAHGLVGAPGDDDGGVDAGAAVVFQRDGSAWTRQARLIANDAAAGDLFGVAVSISDDYGLVGAPGDDDGGIDAGAAYVFWSDGSIWIQQAKLSTAEAGAGDLFGAALAVSGPFAVVGAAGDDDGGIDAGAAYIFRRVGTTWIEQAKLTAADAAAGDRFGAAVAISGRYVIVGAAGDDDGGDDSGSIYVFRFNGSSWIELSKITAGDAAAGDNFGGAVAIDDANLFVGAAGDDDGGEESGAAYLFTIESYHTARIGAEPKIIEPGGSSTLSWTSVNAAEAALDNGIGEVPVNGSMTVRPAAATTYTITTIGPYGTDTASATVLINRPPSIAIVEPDGLEDSVDTAFAIRWTDDDPDDDASIALYYDNDNSGADGTLIAGGLSENSDQAGDDAYIWDTGDIGNGNYYVYAVIDDGVNEPVVAYSDGVVTIDHGPFSPPESRLSAGDAFAYDMFGISVSISGDVAIVGAFGDDDGGSYSGSAYIFERQGDIWVQQAKLTADDAQAQDHFAYSVAIDGDFAIVGAADDDDSGSSSGSAYVFKRDGANWIQQAKLLAADGATDDYFGRSVSISGDFAIVGAYYDDDDGLNSGSAYIFKRDGESWARQAKITADDAAAEDHFGSSVSIAGDYAIVGAEDVDDMGNSSGAAYIFKRNGTVWIQQAKLSASDAQSYQYFGDAVSIYGDYAIVGSFGDDDGGTQAGAAYIFKRNGSDWIQQAKLTAEDAAASDLFGRSVSLSGDVAVIGAAGNDDDGSSSGSAYVFRRDGSDWVQKAKLTAADAAPEDLFGASVSISGSYAVVGAPYRYGYSGSAYFYALPIPTVALSANPDVIPAGDAATLAWTSNNAFSCNIEPGVGEVEVEGTIVVSPTQTTTYTITASGPQGTATDRMTVNVYDPNAPITVSAAAEPADLQPAQSSTLTWSSTNAVSCVIEPDIGPVDLSGSITVSPTQTTAYTITATNPVGTTTATVTVAMSYPPPTANISAQPGAIYSGESSTLTWSSTNALFCSIEPGIGAVDPNGSITVSPTQTTTYTITASNPEGTASQAATVTVTVPPSLPEFKLTAEDGQPHDAYGRAVSISGDFAIVGAYGDDDAGSDSGAAYILKRMGSDWVQEAKLTAADAAAGDNFGQNVSISGNYAIVAAPYDDDAGSYSGSAYVFKREEAGWIQQAKLTAADAAEQDYFGNSVSISGDYALVSAYLDDDGGNYSGSAYIFKRDGSSWSQQAKLTASDAAANQYFGTSVFLIGEDAIVGATGDNSAGSESGAVYIFKLEGSDWIEQTKLTAADAAAGDYFGRSVSISGNYAIIGANGSDDGGDRSGSAYIFKREGSVWVEQTKLIAADAAAIDLFGNSASISGDYAIVGAWGNDDAGNYSGSAYMFKREGEDWNQLAKLTSEDAASLDDFGVSVSISGDYAIVGARGDDDKGSNSGSAYIYTLPIPIITLSADPEVIGVGESTILTWDTLNATSCTIEPGIGAVDISGSITLSPAETTTYTITATGPEGTLTDSVTVQVYDPNVPITVDAAADPANIQPGQSATLTWSTANAVSCVIMPGIGPVDLDGSITVSPTQTTTYSIIAANPVGMTIETVTVAVIYPLPAVSISAQPGTIDSGESATLTWSSTDAVSCVIEPGIGSVDLNGSISVSPTETTTYTITAANPGGTVNDSATVTVIPPLVSGAKLIAGDGQSGDRFGISVSISGDYAIAGAVSGGDGADNTGSAYILKLEGSSWNEETEITTDDAASGDEFGCSVGIDGDYAIVGARSDDDGASNSGSAYIFKREGSSWIQQAKLTADDAAVGDQFGYAVSISGDYAIVGANGNDDGGSNSGSAYLFKREDSSWIQQAKLTADDAAAGDQFGISVSISGDHAIVGAHAADDSGAAYIFKLDGSGWIQQAKLTASDAAVYDNFGISVSISGDHAIVGAYAKNVAGSYSGAAYIFGRDGSSWTQQARITASDAAVYDYFGYSVSISGDHALVGAPGKIIVGYYSGAAYLFKREGSGWVQFEKLTADEPTTYALFGYGVSISSHHAIVGAYGDSDNGSNSGAVYIYSLPKPALAISADATVVPTGEPVTLTWSSQNTDARWIEPDIGAVDADGSIVVSPTGTTTYTITATSAEGTLTESVTVYVFDPAAPIAVSAAADPVSIQPGQSTTLTWSSTNAVSCVIEPGIGPVDLNGSLTVSPADTTTYTITAANPAGAASETVTVTVSFPPPTAESQSITTVEDTPVDIYLQASDSAGKTLTYVVVNSSIKGTLSDDDGDNQVTYFPDAEYAGGDSFAFKVNNGYSDSNVATVSITVEAVNDPPVANEDTATTEATVAIDIDVLANDTDADGEDLSMSSFTQPANGTVVDIGGGILTYTPTAGFNGTDNFTYTITDGNGASAQGLVSVFVVSPISLEITSPLDGEWIYRPDVMVEGTFTHTAGIETGVTVNGAAALVYGGQFVANHVPLVEGENTITAKATDLNGYKATAEITVYVETTGDYIRITSDTQSGVSPFETELKVEGTISFSEEPSISVIGPDDVDYLDSLGDDRYNIGMTAPGIYYISAEATDEEAHVYTDTIALVVMDLATMDAALRGKWNGMRQALMAGNFENAVSFIKSNRRAAYDEVFRAIPADQINNLIPGADKIELVDILDGKARYVADIDILVNGQTTTISSYIIFVYDTDGVWKIKFF